MKLSGIIFEIFLFCAVLQIGAGYTLDIFEGQKFGNPEFLFFHLNPRFDRFVYWLFIDTGVYLSFFLLAYSIETFMFTKKVQRLVLKAFQAFFLGELFTTYLVQFFLSGRNANNWILIIFSLIVFANLFILDKYFPRDQFNTDSND